MRRILAIAGLTATETVRNRLLPVLAILLLCGIAALHASVTGDGTPAGRVRVFLQYGLALTMALVGAAVLWSACAAVSLDVESRRIQLSAVKPVRRAQLWFGRWLGTLGVGAVLLGLGGLAVYAFVKADARATAGEPLAVLRNEVLVGRRLVRPAAPSFAADVAKEAERLEREGRVPEGMKAAEVVAELSRRRAAADSTVAPGAVKEWHFGSVAATEAATWLRIRFSSSYVDRKPVNGTWRMLAPDGRELAALAAVDLYDGAHLLAVPPAARPAGAPFTLRFENAGRERSCTVVFPPGEDVELLFEASGFGRNLLCALAVLLCRLALLAALGVTAGSVFSFPVATFVAIAVLVMAVTGQYLSSPGEAPDSHHAPAPLSRFSSLVQTAGGRIGAVIDRVARPVSRFAVIGALADGVLVSGAEAAHAFVLLVLCYSGALAAAGSSLLARRELALPE